MMHLIKNNRSGYEDIFLINPDSEELLLVEITEDQTLSCIRCVQGTRPDAVLYLEHGDFRFTFILSSILNGCSSKKTFLKKPALRSQHYRSYFFLPQYFFSYFIIYCCHINHFWGENETESWL